MRTGSASSEKELSARHIAEFMKERYEETDKAWDKCAWLDEDSLEYLMERVLKEDK